MNSNQNQSKIKNKILIFLIVLFSFSSLALCMITSKPKIECPTCSKKILSTSLNLHNYRVHGAGAIMVKCDQCDKETHKYLLETHKQNAHGPGSEQVNCPQCQKIYTKYSLKDHMRYKHSPNGQRKRKLSNTLETLPIGNEQVHQIDNKQEPIQENSISAHLEKLSHDDKKQMSETLLESLITNTDFQDNNNQDDDLVWKEFLTQSEIPIELNNNGE